MLSLSLYVDDAILLFDEQFRLLGFSEHELQVEFYGYSREERSARVSSVQGCITSAPSVCGPIGMPSRGAS